MWPAAAETPAFWGSSHSVVLSRGSRRVHQAVSEDVCGGHTGVSPL